MVRFIVLTFSIWGFACLSNLIDQASKNYYENDLIFEAFDFPETPRIKPEPQVVQLPVINKAKLKIMIIDTGVSNHYLLKPWLKYSAKENDTEGHGTHVAGLIAYGKMNGQTNFAQMDRLCKEVELIPCKALNHTFSLDKNDQISRSMECLDKALATGVDIINYSGGGSIQGINEFEKWKKFTDRGGIVVAATGNYSEDISKNDYFPASWGVLRDGKVAIKNIYPISSVDQEGFISTRSDFGPNVIYEQGDDIISTYLDNKFQPMSGTSMAAPIFTHKIAKSFCKMQEVARMLRPTRNSLANLEN